MKKMKQILIVVILMVVTIGTEAFSQRNRIYSGDKNVKEIRRSARIFRGQLEYYQKQQKQLLKDNMRLAALMRKANQRAASAYLKMINRNDSLIGVCQDNTQELNNRLADFTNRAAGKDQQEFIDLRRVSDDQLVNVISVVDYFSYNGNKAKSSGDSAAVVNFTFNKVRADVYFSGRLIYYCFLKEATTTKQDFKSFKIPGPGNYRVVFTSLEDNKVAASGRFVDCAARGEIGGKSFAFVADASY